MIAQEHTGIVQPKSKIATQGTTSQCHIHVLFPPLSVIIGEIQIVNCHIHWNGSWNENDEKTTYLLTAHITHTLYTALRQLHLNTHTICTPQHTHHTHTSTHTQLHKHTAPQTHTSTHTTPHNTDTPYYRNVPSPASIGKLFLLAEEELVRRDLCSNLPMALPTDPVVALSRAPTVSGLSSKQSALKLNIVSSILVRGGGSVRWECKVCVCVCIPGASATPFFPAPPISWITL